VQKLIATLQKDLAEHVLVEVIRDSEHDVLELRFSTKRDDPNVRGLRERCLGIKLLVLPTLAFGRPRPGRPVEAGSVVTWHEELLELALRHSEIGMEPDLAVMDYDELYGALMFLRRVEANRK
jgi:hypothetical protein